MSPLGGTTERIILNCPECKTRVAVPAIARGTMARCTKCNGTWRIPIEDVKTKLDEDHADRIAIEVLEQEVEEKEKDGTVVLDTDDDGQDEPNIEKEKKSVLQQVQAALDEDPPDIGDASTPPEVKNLRRERHRLLLEIGQEANEQILDTEFNPFQKKIKSIEKHVRRQRAWLSAVDRTTDANPITRRMEVDIDLEAAVKQLTRLERDYHHALRVLAEALIRAVRHPEIGPHQRERITEIDMRIDALLPPIPQKKGLLSRLRGK